MSTDVGGHDVSPSHIVSCLAKHVKCTLSSRAGVAERMCRGQPHVVVGVWCCGVAVAVVLVRKGLAHSCSYFVLV